MINIGDFHFAKTPMEYIGGGRLGPETPYSLLLQEVFTTTGIMRSSASKYSLEQ